jgi:hypothetical protein
VFSVPVDRPLEARQAFGALQMFQYQWMFDGPHAQATSHRGAGTSSSTIPSIGAKGSARLQIR